jgi:hypothetical protein
MPTDHLSQPLWLPILIKLVGPLMLGDCISLYLL